MDSAAQPPPDIPATRGPAPREARWAAACLLFLACCVLASVSIALSEPSLGWRFVPDPSGQGVLAYGTDRAVKIDRREQALAHIVAVRAAGSPPETALRLDSLVAVEAPSMLPRQEDLDRFFVLQQRVWEVLDAALQQGRPVLLQTAEGRWIERAVSARAWSELGWLYWVPLVCGVIPFVVGAALAFHRWHNLGARFLALASVMALAALAEVSVVTGRLWLLPPWFAEAGQTYVRCTSLVAMWAFAMMLLHYPTPLARAGAWTRATAGFLGLLLLLNIAQWPDSQTLRYKLWLAVAGLAMLGLALRQATSRRGDPVHRAAGRWLAASAVAAISIVVYAFLVSLVYDATAVSNSYRWVSVPLLYLGLMASVGRSNLFELERWWLPLTLWYLGGTLVVATDLVLVALLRVDAGAAITLSLVGIGWLYFPLRQWLLSRLRSSARPQVSAFIPDLIGAVNAGLGGPQAAGQAWSALLQRVFAPLGMERAVAEPAGAAAQAVRVQDQGRQLRVPDVGAQGAWILTLAQGGRQLFTGEHARMASQLLQLLEHGLAQQRQSQQAVEQERRRIAADLHDDLGARLLSLAQARSGADTSAQARQALEEMRRSVRGMAGKPVDAEVALADWRAELVGRLDGAGFEASWEAQARPPGLVLQPHLHLQLGRILREAVSNAIRHSGGRRCAVRILIDAGGVRIDVEDDGRGLAEAAASGGGLGLPGIERRARMLGGEHAFLRSTLGGLHLRVRVPLAAPPQPGQAEASATIGPS